MQALATPFENYREQIRNRKPKGTELNVLLEMRKEDIVNNPIYGFIEREPELSELRLKFFGY
jgi:hypothetical protein